MAVVVIMVVGFLWLVGDRGAPESGEAPTQLPVPSRREAAAVADGAGVGSPLAPRFPPVPPAGGGAGYLAGDGGVLVDAHRSVGALVRTEPPDEAGCIQVGDGLDSLATPAVLYERAGQVPDEVVQELFIGLTASTLRFLAACAEGNERLRGELAFQWVLIDRRLSDLGVPQ